MLPTISLGPITLPVPGLLLILAVFVTLELASRHAPRWGLDGNHAYNAGGLALAAGAVGARLVYVLLHVDAYTRAPLDIINPSTPGAWAITPGVLIGALAWVAYVRRRRVAWRDLLDAFAGAAPVTVFLAALADLAAGTAFGQPTDLPWAIPLWGAARHPTQVYTLLGAVAAGALVWRSARARPYPGHTTLVFLAAYGVAHMAIEGLRADSWLLPGGLRGAQVLALAAAVGALALLARNDRRAPPPPEPGEEGRR